MANKTGGDVSTANRPRVFFTPRKGWPVAGSWKCAWKFRRTIPIPMSAASPAG